MRGEGITGVPTVPGERFPVNRTYGLIVAEYSILWLPLEGKLSAKLTDEVWIYIG